MAELEIDQRLKDAQREYLDFLDDEESEGIYSMLVKAMVSDKKKRLLVNINHLRQKNPKRAASLLNNAFEEQLAFKRALKEYVGSFDPTYAQENEEFFIAFEGSFGNKHVTPRTLTSKYLGNLVCVEGIVTKCSLVRPKVVRSVHYCPATKKVLERRYTDLTSFDAFPSSAVYPTKVPGTRAEWEAIADDFFLLWNFPNCLGAIDGKHIQIKAPENAGSYFYNYKGHHSIVLLAVADARYRFIYVDVGVNGRISDGGVFRISSLASAIARNSLNFPPMKKLSNEGISVPYVFVADDAFPLSPRIMKPYPQRGLDNEKSAFNHRLSRARRVIENAFGIMSSRFRVFLNTIALSPEKVDKIVLAATTLHNLLITSDISRERYLEEINDSNTIQSLGSQSGRRPSTSAIQIREEFQRYFVSHPI